MSATPENSVATICRSVGGDRRRLMDVVLATQAERRCVDAAAVDVIASELSVPRVDVASVVSFYSFLSPTPLGQVVIRVSNDVVDLMKGAERLAEEIADELGIGIGETTADGRFTLEYTSCIGMSDQAPAVLVNGLVMPKLGPSTARRGIRILQEADDLASVDLHKSLIHDYGDGNNSHHLVRAAVSNNLRQPGDVIFSHPERGPMRGQALEKALAMSPAEVIREIKTARLRGRGGAGFPTGMKWEYTRAAGGAERYLICNADEGEPGTFKDRVILTERPDLMFEGMTVGAYAIGARHGIVYLRAEYEYLRAFLEHILAERRAAGLLGKSVCGMEEFEFDIRIQMGAGAYICGEETALIGSCEGLRGDPKTRPPFPAHKGYRGKPTSVNNVETLCCAARILEMGSGWFSSMGTRGSTGTKLLSVSGDCRRPGVYEVPFGLPLREVFELCGADDPKAAQVGGPSGQMVGEADFDRRLEFDDLATGGSLMVFGRERNVVEIAASFMRFFIHESCGYCTPCRVGNVLLEERLEKILSGLGEPDDLAYLEELGRTVKTASRCGLGQTSAHPVLSTLASFRSDYEALLHRPSDGRQAGFSLARAVSQAEELTGRRSIHAGNREDGSGDVSASARTRDRRLGWEEA